MTWGTATEHDPGGTVPPTAQGADQRSAYLSYAGIALAVLGAIWGFLKWWGIGSDGVNGYRIDDGYLVVAVPLLAALFALAHRMVRRDVVLSFLAAGASLVGMFFAIVAISVKPGLIQVAEGAVDHSASRKIGIILMLITTILQFLALTAAWLIESGRLPQLANRGSGQGYGTQTQQLPTYQQPERYSAPYQPQQPHPQPQHQPSYQPPAAYQPPTAPPSYQPPAGYQPPPPGYAPPPPPPPAQPEPRRDEPEQR